MIAGLKRRLSKIEEQYGSRWGDTAAVADRITRAVLATLSDAELVILEAYVHMPDDDRRAEPNAGQRAVLDLYEQRYRELETMEKVGDWNSN